MRVEATLPPLAEPRKTAPPTEDLTCGAGAELKRIREALRISQAEVAKVVGLERTSITNIERGKQKLSLVLLRAIADALGMEVVLHLRPKAQPTEAQVKAVLAQATRERQPPANCPKCRETWWKGDPPTCMGCGYIAPGFGSAAVAGVSACDSQTKPSETL